MSLISSKKVENNVVELLIAVSEEQLQAATLAAYKKNEQEKRLQLKI